MAQIAWDRLFETCYAQGATDILLVPGYEPLIRTTDHLRALQLPPLSAEEVAAMAEEKLTSLPTESLSQVYGYVFADFDHRNVARFRVMAFSYPRTNLVVVMRLADEGAPSLLGTMSAPRRQF